MIGWRARLGFLVPPGNPTVETEMIGLVPDGVSLHFHRMVAHGTPGSLSGQTERNRTMVEHIDSGIELLALVKADVIVIAHTATSYHLGRRGEAELLEQDLSKPVFSSASAMMWHALRLAGVGQPIAGYGRRLTLK